MIEDLSSTGAFAVLNIYILADQRREPICRTINYSLESLMVAWQFKIPSKCKME